VLALDVAAQVLGEVRKRKSEAQRPLKTPVTRVLVRATPDQIALLRECEADLMAAGLIERLEHVAGDPFEVVAELAAEPLGKESGA